MVESKDGPRPDEGKRLEHRLRIVERRDRLLLKDRSEERSVFEEVFDRSTLMTVYGLMNSGEIEDIYGAVKAGKESKIYWGRSPNGEDLAIKIYLVVSAEFRRGMIPYIMGDHRFKNVKRDSRSLVYTWAQKEFRNLSAAYEAGVKVPKPVAVKNNVLVMEFVGEDGISAPLMREADLNSPRQFLRKILEHVARLYQKARLVHGDLSEYNVMVWKGEPVIFDLSQSVPLEHPNADEFLRRDLENLQRYFMKLGVDVPSVEEMQRRVTRERLRNIR